MSLILISAVATSSAPLMAQDPVPDAAELARRLELLAAEVQELRGGRPTAGAELDSGGLGPAASTVYSAAPGQLSWASYGEITYKRPDATTDAGAASGLSDTWDLHRAVLYLGYRFDENWLFNAEIEFEHGDEVGVEFAYLEARVNEALGVRAGHLLVPLGLINETHEPTTFYSAQRPLVETFVIPSTWHENGLGVVTDWGGFSARAYVMNGFDASGFDLGKDGLRGGRQGGGKASAEDLALAARLDWEGIPGLLLGLGAFSGDSGQGAGASDFGTTVMEAHAQWQWRALRLRGLWAQGSVEDAALLATPAPGEDLEGWYLEAGYDVLAGADLDGQALTPFVRWEEYDLSADAPGDSGVRALTVGLAWQPIAQVVFKADYTDLSNDADSVADSFAFTVGWAF